MPGAHPTATPPDAAAAEPLRIGPGDSGRPVSAAGFAAADCAEPWTYERVEGRLLVWSPDGRLHVRSSTPWLSRLIPSAGAHPDRVQAVVPSPQVRISPATERIGDLGGALDDLNLPDQIPDLIFEFVSPARADRRRDYSENRADHWRTGVRGHVIVHRFDRKVTVLTLHEGANLERALPADGTDETPRLPGLVIELAGIWPE